MSRNARCKRSTNVTQISTCSSMRLTEESTRTSPSISYVTWRALALAHGHVQLAIMNAGSVGGRILPNFVADRVGPYNMLIPCLAISSALIFSIFALKTCAAIIVFAALYGFWSGSCGCSSFVCLLSPHRNCQMCRSFQHSSFNPLAIAANTGE